MLSPYDYTKLFRKEGVSDEIKAGQVSIDEYYDRYRATLDLSQICDYNESWFDKQNISNIIFNNGICVIALISITKLRTAIAEARKQTITQDLLTHKQ